MMFYGLRTAIYRVGDLDRAKEWYGAVLGIRPYFDEPFYVGFDVGGFELGLQPDESGAPRARTGVVAYWGVNDADAAFRRLLELGASIAGFRTSATVSGWRPCSTLTATCSASSKTLTSRSNMHNGCAWNVPLYPIRLLLRLKGSQIPLLETREG